MPKGRMLNKTVSLDLELAKCSPQAIILYTWGIPHLDSGGKMPANIEIIKGTVVPYLKFMTPRTIAKALEELNATPLVIVYGSHVRYIKYNGFGKNQTIREDRETPSEIPDPTPEELQQHSGITPAQFNLSKYKCNDPHPLSAGVAPEKKKILDFVFLTADEHDKLVLEYGQDKINNMIEQLNNYICSHGKKYKSHYHTIKNWIRMEKDRNGPEKPKVRFD